MELKEKLKKIRKERNISQQALADAIFVSRSAVAKWESGLGIPCDDAMESLERFFGVEKGYFLSDKPEELIASKNVKLHKTTYAFRAVTGVLITIILVLIIALVVLVLSPKTFLKNIIADDIDYITYVTAIEIADPSVYLYGLTINCSADEFTETFEDLGFTVEIHDESDKRPFRYAIKDGIVIIYAKFSGTTFSIVHESRIRDLW